MLITTRDGRHLQVEIYGPPEGVPLVFHNTTPGSAVPYPALQRAAWENDVRLVTFARAGYGRSTRLPGRAVVDAAADVEDILDHMNADRCVVLGWSGGGPHALATAARLTGRVAAVASVSGFAPFDAEDLDFDAGMGEANVQDFQHALQGADAISPGHEAAAASMKFSDAESVVNGLKSLLSEHDRSFLAVGTVAQDIADSLREGVQQGAAGWIDDDLAFVKPWGFSVNEISVPAFVWQGGQDLMVPAGHGEWLARHIPQSVAHLYKNKGHFSIALGLTRVIVQELCEAL
ncbi:alpha/beta fold hydrolase [Streptomyces sp. NPDC058108]|uniref:alpha/beta fold hydrolase n=1 Tax=Streptomyces sp. NPDC058108 TaxID=3346344 RepID=UPI0036EB8E38